MHHRVLGARVRGPLSAAASGSPTAQASGAPPDFCVEGVGFNCTEPGHVRVSAACRGLYRLAEGCEVKCGAGLGPLPSSTTAAAAAAAAATASASTESCRCDVPGGATPLPPLVPLMGGLINAVSDPPPWTPLQSPLHQQHPLGPSHGCHTVCSLSLQIIYPSHAGSLTVRVARFTARLRCRMLDRARAIPSQCPCLLICNTVYM